MCFCVRMGLFVVIWLINGRFFFLVLLFNGIFNLILWDVFGRILIIFFLVSVFKCFFVVFVEWNFSLWVILVCVGGMLVFVMVDLMRLSIFCCWGVNGCINSLFFYIVNCEYIQVYINDNWVLYKFCVRWQFMLVVLFGLFD